MGRHNGHEALSYAPLTDLDPTLADALLDVLAEEGIAAYVVPALRRPSIGMVQPRVDRPLDRVYVDAAALAPARQVLHTHLPLLHADHETEAARQGAASGGGGVLVGDEAWASVLASYALPTEGLVRSWPSREDLDETDDTPPRPGRLLRRATDPHPGDEPSPLPDWAWERDRPGARHRRGKPRTRVDDADDLGEGHYVPPPPPPLPATDLATRLAWIAVLGGPLILLVGAWLDWDLNGWLGLLGVVAFTGGFAALVMGMHDPDPDDYDPDDGAVV